MLECGPSLHSPQTERIATGQPGKAFIRVLLHAATEAELNDDTVAALKAAVERRQAGLERKSVPLGGKNFAERTDCFLDRIETYWSIWG